MKTLSSHFSGSITVVDLDCVPGFFTIEIAKKDSNGEYNSNNTTGTEPLPTDE